MHTQTGTLRASQVLVRFSPGMPRSSRTPADPQRTHLVVLSVLASGPLRPSPSALAITGLYQASGSAVFPVAYLIPCVCFKCVVRFADTRGLCPFFRRVGVAGISFPTPRFSLRGGHFSNRTSTSFTLATLGTSDGLGLTRQRLALCKKRQALLGAPTASVSRPRECRSARWLTRTCESECGPLLERSAGRLHAVGPPITHSIDIKGKRRDCMPNEGRR